ncbi:MAG: hypothetical protein L3J10_05125 [Sulfurimonas sp.]|nr:hypothetical protein [Sulfurimonas sp.]
MGFFTQKECQQCLLYEKEIDALTIRNNQFERALRKLKQQYDEAQTQEVEIKDVENENIENISPVEIDELFQNIKTSSYDKDVKRYLRSLLMLIKSSYNPSLHKYLLSQLN